MLHPALHPVSTIDAKLCSNLSQPLMADFAQLPVTVTLAALLKACFPEEYEERAKEAAATGLALQGATETEGDGGEETVTLPLFTMSPLFPGASMALNIFEPRWLRC